MRISSFFRINNSTARSAKSWLPVGYGTPDPNGRRHIVPRTIGHLIEKKTAISRKMAVHFCFCGERCCLARYFRGGSGWVATATGVLPTLITAITFPLSGSIMETVSSAELTATPQKSGSIATARGFTPTFVV